MHISSELFDSKPLLKRRQKQAKQQQIQKRLEHAISECVSSYMKSKFKQNKKSYQYVRFQSIQSKASRNSHRNQQFERQGFCQQKQALEQQNLSNNQKAKVENSQKIGKISGNMKENIYEFICEILKVFKSISFEQINSQQQEHHNEKQKRRQTKKIERNSLKEGSNPRAQQNLNLDNTNHPKNKHFNDHLTQKSNQKQSKQLTQSNKNFILQLLMQLGLLKMYRGIDRRFHKLVEEAQSAYYSVHNLIQRVQCLNQDNDKRIQSKKQIKQEIKDIFMNKRQQVISNEGQKLMKMVDNLTCSDQQNLKQIDVISQFNSMKKRLNQAQLKYYKMQQTLQSQPGVCGYENNLSQIGQNQNKLSQNIDQNDNHHGQNGAFSKITINQQTCQQMHEKDRIMSDSESNSLSSGLYFTQAENISFQRVQILQKSCLLSPDDDDHKEFIKIVSNWKQNLKYT